VGWSILAKLPMRARLGLSYSVFLVLMSGAIAVFLLTALETSLLQDIDEDLRFRAGHVERELEDATGGHTTALVDHGAVMSALSELAPNEEFSAPGIYMQVLNTQNQVLGSSPNVPVGFSMITSSLLANAEGGSDGFDTIQAEGESIRVLVKPLKSEDRIEGFIVVGESLHLLNVTIVRTRQLLLAGIVGSTVVAFLGGWWLSSHALGPILAITRVARHISDTGQFAQRIAIPLTRDEVSELASAFNEMLGRLEDAFQRQREFLADASHELRGPLMIIRGNLDLLKHSLPTNEKEECLQDVAEEVDRMAQLISDLLFLAEAEARETVEHRPVELNRIIDNVWERALAADGGKHDLQLLQNEPVVIPGDHERIHQLVWNLLENALRYTPANGYISLAVHRHATTVEIVVQDTGIGIPSEHLPYIFERFYRVDRSRSRAHGGSGLGLAIVRQVVEAHRGQIYVQSQQGAGSIFTVNLPVEPENASA
jgi:heavy metal sensor kinase